MARKYTDPYLKIAKDRLVAMLRSRDEEVHRMQRIQIGAFADATIQIDDPLDENAQEFLRVEVFTPCDTSGGIVRITWIRREDTKASNR